MCLDWEEKCDGKEPCIYHPAQGLCAAQTQGGIICTSLGMNGAFWKSIEHIANGVLELNNVVALITITHSHMYTHTCTRRDIQIYVDLSGKEVVLPNTLGPSPLCQPLFQTHD